MAEVATTAAVRLGAHGTFTLQCEADMVPLSVISVTTFEGNTSVPTQEPHSGWAEERRRKGTQFALRRHQLAAPRWLSPKRERTNLGLT